MSELNITAIQTAHAAVQELNAEYTPMHEEYLKAMSTAGAYEPVPEYVGKTGELLTPEVIIQMISTGEVTKTGIVNAVSAGKIRKITAVKSAELIAMEITLNAAVDEYHRICAEQIAAVSVKKCRAGKTTSGEYRDAPAGIEYINRIRARDPAAVLTLSGRQLTGKLSTGVDFSYNVYGQDAKTGQRNMDVFLAANNL